MGQGAVEAEIGLRDKAPGMVEAFKEVAPATVVQTTLFGVGKKGLDVAHNKLKGKQLQQPVFPPRATGGLTCR